ncbi:MAG: hypothetical protein M1816_007404 [Peltula sp. TS41687]|nr:MAG: hypothetical protein M1816_007404 [Peltula sp. TS41687]
MNVINRLTKLIIGTGGNSQAVNHDRTQVTETAAHGQPVEVSPVAAAQNLDEELLIKVPATIQAYWNNPESAISKSDMKEYLKWSRDGLTRLQRLATQKEEARQQMEAQRDELRTILQTAKANLAVLNSDTLTAAEIFLRGHRGAPSPPKPIRRVEDITGLTDKQPGSFLYDNLPDQISEMTVKAMLIQAERAVKQRRWAQAYELAVGALGIARQLEFPPLMAKCYFWKGWAEYRQGMWAAALESFVCAEPCRRFYLESRWLDECRKMAEEGARAELSRIDGRSLNME